MPLFLLGCAGAELIKTTQNPKGGVVQYKNGAYVRDESRGIALKKIESFCLGSYKIIKEEFNPDVFSVVFSGIHYTNDKNNLMYIQFECY